MVVFLVHQHTNHSDAMEEGLCLKLGVQDLVYLPFISGQSCTPDEVMMLMDFDKLDLDGNGKWTYQEAQELEQQYAQDMKRYLDLSGVYKSVMEELKTTDSKPTTPCQPGEVVEVDMDDGGNWWPVTFVTMTNDNHIGVVVNRQDSFGTDCLIKKNGTDCKKSPCQEEERVRISSDCFPNLFIDPSVTFLLDTNDGYADVEVIQAVQIPIRNTRKEEGLACSFTKCVDTDFGATDTYTSGCFAYWTSNYFEAYCFEDSRGPWDNSDFKLMEMCCVCGGGSTNLTMTGIGHLPVNVSWDSFMEQKAWRKCTQAAHSTEGRRVCDQQHTFVSRAVYEAQLAPFIRYCVLSDPDLCGNLQARGTLPAWNTTVTDFIPLFFRKLGIGSLDEMDPKEICKKSITTVCPTIFPHQFGHFRHQREDECGKKTTDVEQGSMTVSYEGSQVYNDPGFGLMTWKFRLFLLLIVFLWGLASIEEFRLIIVWWNVLLTLPTVERGKPCTASKLGEDSEGTFEVIGLHRRTRVLAIMLDLLPRSTLQVFIFTIGIQYLLSVRNVSDLILSLCSHLEQGLFPYSAFQLLPQSLKA